MSDKKQLITLCQRRIKGEIITSGDLDTLNGYRGHADDFCKRLDRGDPEPSALAALAPVLSDSECREVFGIGQPPVKLAEFSPDDLGNADAFTALHGADYAYSDAIGWLKYTGTHWEPEGAEAALDHDIAQMLRTRQHAAIDAQREKVISAATPNAKRIRDCKYLLQSRFFTKTSEFDTHDHLLNVANGVINLKNGDILPHNRYFRFTWCLATPYEQNADTAPIKGFVDSVVKGGANTTGWLQTILGLCLTGDTRFEIVLYLHGPTRAGKGTLIEAIMHLLGGLCKPLNFAALIEKRDPDANNFDLAPLRNCRLVIADESDRRDRLNGAKLKTLTGGNALMCAFKHRDFFSYRPKFKILMVSNWPPNADADDDAIWSRLRVVEFPNSYAGKEDFELKSKLKTMPYQEALLAWMVQGAIRFYESGSAGIKAPDLVIQSTQDRRNELDEVGQWLAECCTMGNGNFCDNEKIYTSYGAWCKNNGYNPKTAKSLTGSLKSKKLEVGVLKRMNDTVKRGVIGFYVN